jgi:hypothetical protein
MGLSLGASSPRASHRLEGAIEFRNRGGRQTTGFYQNRIRVTSRTVKIRFPVHRNGDIIAGPNLQLRLNRPLRGRPSRTTRTVRFTDKNYRGDSWSGRVRLVFRRTSNLQYKVTAAISARNDERETISGSLVTPNLLRRVPSPGAPSSQWFTSHEGSREESHGHNILTCSDGGFLQVGETGFIPQSARIMVVKTNATGGLLWKKEIGSSGHNLGNSVIEVSDGYLVAGALNQNSTVIKLNKDTGDILFSETVNNGGSDAYEHIAEVPRGLVAVGYRNAADPSNTFYTEGIGYLTLLNPSGVKQSGLTLPNSVSHAYRIKNSGSDLVISGLTPEAQNYVVGRFDYSGNATWIKTFGGSRADHCFGLDLGSDGSIFLTGHTVSGTANWDTYTMKIDPAGTLLWQKILGNPRGFNPRFIHDETWGIKATSDGGCLITAGTGDEYEEYSSCFGGACSDRWEVYLVKFDSSGEVEWETTFGRTNEDWAGEDVALTTDGGAIIAVDNGQFGFLKINPF